MTCNINNVATAKTLSVKAGDKVHFEWHHEDRCAGDQIIDPSHKSPVLGYIAPGDYLLRGETIALHEGFFVSGAQFYMECVQIKITSPEAPPFPQAFQSLEITLLPTLVFSLICTMALSHIQSRTTSLRWRILWSRAY
ncbi:uncharacterized protein A1O9_09663 [Exophiala aquamarina CBS 119918]|uniref:AA9 family lytic polysaccharide monooxygenase n=1 Tax=Exophiala aquamarina CBS 119918 TaxID=1182545 RepID=A0A072P3R0_9EURO|nr:uncharacterized protein A1O9_09663 [Exophiala aquamarina CBS 119918]KEF54496.1 hypothetical protein A1O9_09663 [Exophiala aquamarina CBS 119918]